METGTATKTVHFELDIISGDEDRPLLPLPHPRGAHVRG